MRIGVLRRLTLIALLALTVACGGPSPSPTPTGTTVSPEPTSTASVEETPRASAKRTKAAAARSEPGPCPQPARERAGKSNGRGTGASSGHAGLYLADADLSVRRKFRIPDEARVLLLTTLEDGPASSAGLGPGVPVYRIGSVRPRNARQAQAALGRLTVGRSVAVRAGAPDRPEVVCSHTVTLEPSPEATSYAFPEQLRRRAERRPSDVYAQWAYAYYLLKAPDSPSLRPQAGVAIDRLLKLAPRFGSALLMKAEHEVYRGNKGRAYDYTLKAIEAEPDYGDAHAMLAILYDSDRVTDPLFEGVAKMEKLETSDARAALAYYLAGTAAQHGEIADPERARAYYTRSLERMWTRDAKRAVDSLRSAPKVARSHKVTYKVRGAGAKVSVEYTGVGGKNDFNKVDVPWSHTFRAELGQTTMIAVWQPKGGGPVRCEVYVDGKLSQSQDSSAEGAWPFGAKCLGTLGNGEILDP